MAADQEKIKQYQDQWSYFNSIGDEAGKQAAHAAAEAERAKDGYSGGADGSQQISYGDQYVRNEQYGDVGTWSPVAGGGLGFGTTEYRQASRTLDNGSGRGADKDLLSTDNYATVKGNQANWLYYDAQAKAAEQAGNYELAAQYRAQRDAEHASAEQIRNGAFVNYSGGADGMDFITGIGGNSQGAGGYGGYSGGGSSRYGSGYSAQGGSQAPSIELTGRFNADTAGLKNMLEQWQTAAIQQQNGAIDYNVQQAVKALERALEDAQPQFVEQQESIARDERQAMDNSALYAELRGDKGGIGQAQYNEIQAQAARNRQTVQQAQTKLATDTARQIEDLRAQGEFQKADAMLQISQQYLSKLMDLEQWAQQYNLTAAQFEASLQEWQYEYQMAMDQFNAEMGYKYDALAQNQAQFDSSLGYNYAQLAQNQSQFDATMSFNSNNQLASLGQSMLAAGIMPTAEQLKAMNMSSDQASQYLASQQLQQASKGSGKSGSSSSSGSGSSSGSTNYIQALYSAGKDTKEAARNYLMNTYGLGYNTANSIAAEYMQAREKKEQADADYALRQVKADVTDINKLVQTYVQDQAPAASVTSSLGNGSSAYSSLREQIGHINPGTTANVAAVFYGKIVDALTSGSITQSEADKLLKMLGY